MIFKTIKATSNELKQKTFAIRKEVFIKEQRVDIAEEFDKFEDESHHFVVLDEKDIPIGAARWRYTDKGIKLERFAVKKSMRGKGIGSLLIKNVLDDIATKTKKGIYLYMHAQLPAIPLYLKFGFQIEGNPFEECEITHYLMHRKL